MFTKQGRLNCRVRLGRSNAQKSLTMDKSNRRNWLQSLVHAIKNDYLLTLDHIRNEKTQIAARPFRMIKWQKLGHFRVVGHQVLLTTLAECNQLDQNYCCVVSGRYDINIISLYRYIYVAYHYIYTVACVLNFQNGGSCKSGVFYSRKVVFGLGMYFCMRNCLTLTEIPNSET